MSQRVLVTGGSGFIGSHIVDALIDAGREVVVLDSRPRHYLVGGCDQLNELALHIRGDLRDRSVVEAAIRGVDAVCHQAAVVGIERSFDDVVAYVSSNDLGSAVLLRALHAAQWRGPLVLASSMVVYGEGAYRCRQHGAIRPGPRGVDSLSAGAFESRCPRCGQELTPFPVEESAPLEPASIYAATKVHQEHLFAAFGRSRGMPVARLRYHNVYGPRMPKNTSYAGVASIFSDALRHGCSPEVFEDGGQLRDFIHVRDIAAANVAAVEAAYDGALNIATGRPRSILDVATEMSHAIDPALSPWVSGAFRPGDVRHVFASPNRARAALDWEAKIGFGEGMRGLALDPLTAGRRR